MSDQLDTDLGVRYTERPKHPPTDHSEFDPPTAWVNYWDMNPVEHGGKYVTWTGRAWRAVEVGPPSMWGEPEHIVTRYRFRPADVWVDPDDPWTDFADDMKRILRSLGDEHHLPVAPPFLGSVTYYVADLTHYRSVRHETFEIDEGDVDAYWSHVSGYDVDPSEVQNVSKRDLPDDATSDD
jgi:hypothetical protein